MVTYQLKQDGLIVVEVTGSEEQAKKEINHYAMIYSQDGEVEIIKKGDSKSQKG